jgi:hypothetical protein
VWRQFRQRFEHPDLKGAPGTASGQNQRRFNFIRRAIHVIRPKRYIAMEQIVL